MIKGKGDSASEKQRVLRAAGVHVAGTLEEIPSLLRQALRAA
jgi:succinyl-CoA synthetase alpha subunit